jgi:hypothetical protein
MKRGDIMTKVKGNLTAIEWKAIRNVNILMNIHFSPSEGNFFDEYRKAMKLAIKHD